LRPDTDLKYLADKKEANSLITLLAKFPSVVKDAAESTEPCVIVGYLFDVSHSLSTAMSSLNVLSNKDNASISEPILLLFHATRITLGNGLKILGLNPIERM